MNITLKDIIVPFVIVLTVNFISDIRGLRKGTITGETFAYNQISVLCVLISYILSQAILTHSFK